ncbi:hypothetical protein MVEN_01335500 [Mycena venus]|uniref:3'-5' exonuclease domain-containing protein n=1 Tax=Mycena venus TaxID=2733690 RepID=A0A8H6Y082_9AGAR|nr:hypothetical protein MVEN_01335500 [Mycena venus]
MPKGRQKGAKNKAGHDAGGARRGAGRPRKKLVSESESEAEPEPSSTNPRGKRKQPSSRGDAGPQSKRRKKSHDGAETSGSNMHEIEAGPSRMQASTAGPSKNIYPMFRQRVGDADTSMATSSLRTCTKGLPNLPDIIPPVISSPDIVPACVAEAMIEDPSVCDPDISAELDSIVDDDGDADRPAEDTPSPEGVVQAYLDRIQKEVHAQIEGKHRKPDCYRSGTFWIRPVNNWFALEKNKDSPEALYYPRVFVWVPNVLMPLDFEFDCIYCEKLGAKMTKNDKTGYAGFSPSHWYVNQVYVEYMGHIKPHQDQAMAALPVGAAHMDQSYKTIKYTARMNGVKVFGSLWTLTNESEQIRQMILTLTRHLHHIERPLRGIVKSLHEHGHAPITLLWTDNVKANRKFVERVIPTLRTGVDHSLVDGGRSYPLLEVSSGLNIRVASSIRLIVDACTSILVDIGDVNPDVKIFVGFAMEWDWTASTNGRFPASLMQILVGDFVYLLQTYHIGASRDVPTSLKTLLFSQQIVKVGSHFQGDLDLLSYLWELTPPMKSGDKHAGSIDIGVFVRSKGLIPYASISLPRIAEEVLGRTVNSSEEMRCSIWGQPELSDGQKQYATQNAWLPLHIFKAIADCPPAGARLLKIGLPGETITLRNGTLAVAQGVFVEQMTQFPVAEDDLSKGYIKLSRTKRALVRITSILSPTFISHYHHRTLEELGPVPFEIVVDLASLVSRENIPEPEHGDDSQVDSTGDGEDSDYGGREESDSSSDSESEQDLDEDCSNPDSGSSPRATTPDDEFESYMDPAIDAYIATHPEGPDIDAHHPLVQPAEATGPQPTHTFQDIFHLMDRLIKHLNKDHSLSKQFARFLRDAIYIPDKIDKARVEAVLKMENVTWDQAVRSKAHWIWQQVRQYVPPPDVLIPILLELFKSHADLKCSKRDIKLFNAECHKAAKLIIEDVRKDSRIDKYGLWLWHSIRGSSRLEGGVHHTVRKKFGSLGASVELTVALLSDYCYHKNVESGSCHKDGVVYDSHYDPWIEDDIDIAYQSLPFDLPRPTRPGYVNVSLFKPTEETFIISELAQKVRDEFDIPRHDQPSSIDDKIPRMPLVNLSGARTDRYGYMASAQDTKFALVPIHTNEEYRLFNKEVHNFMNTDGQLDFKRMAKWWSTQANGKTIFFKIPEFLQSHFKTWTAVRSEITTLHATAEQRAKFMNIIRSDAHTSVVLDESYSPVVQARKAAALSAIVDR